MWTDWTNRLTLKDKAETDISFQIHRDYGLETKNYLIFYKYVCVMSYSFREDKMKFNTLVTAIELKNTINMLILDLLAFKQGLKFLNTYSSTDP